MARKTQAQKKDGFYSTICMKGTKIHDINFLDGAR